MRPWGAVLTGFAVAAAYWPGMLSAVFVPRWAAIAILVPLFFAVDGRRLSTPVLAGLVIFMGGAAVSLLRSPDVLSGIHDLILLSLLGLAFLGASHFHKMDDMMTGLSLGLLPSTIVGFFQMNGWKGIPNLSVWYPSGLFFNSEILGEFAVLLLVWGIVRRKWWIVAIALFPVLASHSRVAMLCLGAALAYAWWRPSRWPLYVLGVIAGVGAIFYGVFLMDGYKLQSAGHRLVLWLTTIEHIGWIGNGLGWASVAFPAERFVHSDLLQMASEIGWPAAVVLFIPWLVFKDARRDVAERAVLVAVIVQAAVSFPLHFPAQGFVAACVAGYLLGTGRLVRMGQSHGGTEDVAGVQRRDAGYAGVAARFGRRGAAVSLRSIFAGRPGPRACVHPAGGG